LKKKQENKSSKVNSVIFNRNLFDTFLQKKRNLCFPGAFNGIEFEGRLASRWIFFAAEFLLTQISMLVQEENGLILGKDKKDSKINRGKQGTIF